MSLDDFQAKYTSEDNSSFTEILDDENRKRKERWAWAWDAQKRVEQQRDKMVECRERRLIEAPPAAGVREKFRIQAPTLAGLITDGEEAEPLRGGKEETDDESQTEKGKQVAVVIEKGAEVDVMAPNKDTRSASVDGWEFKVRPNIVYLSIMMLRLSLGSKLSHVPARCRRRSVRGFRFRRCQSGTRRTKKYQA
jgi:protein DGCR14